MAQQMAGISRVSRRLRLQPNEQGRDLVVGDLHGHRRLLERELERLNFDPLRDRVISVGDLADRGPDSITTLALLDEPWFHAVLGNHELMLLAYLGYYRSQIHARKSFVSRGGGWIYEAAARQRRLLMRLADCIAALPLSIRVEAAVPYELMHGDLRPTNGDAADATDDASICVQQAEIATMSRANFVLALRSPLCSLRFGASEVQLSDTPLDEEPLTFVGHSRVRRITVHRSLVYIDQGVRYGDARRETVPPTVVDATQFAHWVRGVTVARGPQAARTGESRPATADRAPTFA